MEKKIKEIYHSIYDSLLQDASYIGQGNTRYYPIPLLLEQLVWNVLVALFVNLFAAHLYENYLSKKQIIPKEECEKIVHEVFQQIQDKKEIAITNIALKYAENEVRNLLVQNGWPKKAALKDSKEIIRKTRMWLHTLLKVIK